MDKENLIATLTERVLVDRGYSPDDRDLDIEWDETDPDSQYSLVKDDMKIVAEVLDDLDIVTFFS
jgi:hypothetical protein